MHHQNWQDDLTDLWTTTGQSAMEEPGKQCPLAASFLHCADSTG